MSSIASSSVVDGNEHQDRPEDLGLVHLMVRLHAGEDRRRHEVALVIARDPRIAPVELELRAFLHALLDEAFDPRLRLRRDERPQIRVLLGTGVYLERLRLGDDVGNPLVGFADEHRHADRHAALPRGPESRADERIQRLLLVRVGHHDGVVLRAHHALRALATV
jgi:hypothetical protein